MPDITVNAGDGGSFGAYLATPPNGKGPGVVVIQEIFGVNNVMRDICDDLARKGYVAASPDLFWRQKPGVQLTDKSQEEWTRAFAYLKGFDSEEGVGDLQSIVSHVHKLPGCSGKVGAVGYCLGGSLASAAACMTDADCSVGYYPVQIEGKLDFAKNIKRPLLLHIAEKDSFCPPAAQAKIKQGLGANRNITLQFYAGADHAFARIGGEHFDKAAADLANGRTLESFKTNLG